MTRLFFISLFFISSCGDAQVSNNKQSCIIDSITVINPFKEYIDESGERIIEYGDSSQIDSIFAFYPNGQMSYMAYFSNDLLQGEVINQYFYENGNIFSMEINKDTLFIIERQELSGYILKTLYYENGSLKARGYLQGGYSVGLWYNYDTLGNKIQESICIPNEADKANAYVKIKEFHPNGSIKKEWQHYYFDEGEIPIGVTRYYNEQGKLIKTEKHK